MFEYAMAMATTPTSTALLARVRDASRAEAQAAAERLAAIFDLYQARLRDSGECADLAIDTWAAVSAQVAATLRISVGLGSSLLQYAIAMREQVPLVGAVFEAGDIDFRLFKTIVFRTGAVTDPDILAQLDADLAVLAPRWGPKTQRQLATAIDKQVAHRDPDAVRRAKSAGSDRYVEIGETDPGMAEINARVFNTTGMAFGKRLDELADTVCDADPRNRDQRRADALDALVAGADRLVCRCEQDSCPAWTKSRPPGNVQIDVVAEQATLDGRSDAPGYAPEADWLIPAEILREIAAAAKLLPIIPPVDAPPESRYVPSRALARYIRSRDLTCRAPGCSRPAVHCEIDHTIPYPRGATQASNLKCLCTQHHLLKTFCGWHDEQLPDGTVIWTLPDGQKCVTLPGSAYLFPSLCVPTGFVRPVLAGPEDAGGFRIARMPRRSRTRTQHRTAKIVAERTQNRMERLTKLESQLDHSGEPPPF